MALIKCSECGHEVSDKAASCPKCGAPIAGASETLAAGVQIKTIQETSKKFKLQTILSVSLIIISFFWLMAELSGHEDEHSGMPMLLILIGLFWYTINRFRIWWHHK